MTYKNYWLIFLLILIGFIPLFDLFNPGLPITHDGQDHVARIANFYKNLQEGNIIPRWAGNLNWGYGHPILMFLYPLPSYAASLFHFVGFNFIDSLKIVFGITFVLSGVAMYLWLKNVFHGYAAFGGALLYMFAPYRFVDLYVRGAIGEHVAFVFPPLICYFLLKISRQYSRWYLIGGILSLAGLILAHNAITLMFLPIILFYGIFLVFLNRNRLQLAYYYIGILVLGFGISAFFWVPAFFEGKYTLRDIVTKGEFASRFVAFKDFFYGPWNYGISGQFTVQVGVLHWIAVFLFLPSLFLAKKSLRIFGIAIFCLFWIMIFLMTSSSQSLWQNLTTLQKFQFPWRFLSVSVFSSAVLGAFVIYYIPKKFVLLSLMIVTFFALYLSKDYWHAKEYIVKPEQFFENIYDGTTDTGESSPFWSVRFMEKRPNAPIEVISGSAHIRQVERKSAQHVYVVDVTTKSRIKENTLYFPGWQVRVDGKIVDLEFQDPNHRGLMTFFVERGKHTVMAEFKETRLRMFADVISLLSFVVILGFLARKPNTTSV